MPLLGAMAVATTLAPAAPAWAAARTVPSQLLAASVSAARAENAVDYTASVHSGTASDKTEAQAGTTTGTSTVSLREGKLTGRLAVILLGGTAFARGDQHGLQTLDFSVVAAGKEAGRWIRVEATASTQAQEVYQELASTLTVAGAVSSLEMTGTLELLPRSQVNGQAVIGIRGAGPSQTGSSPSTESLYVSAGGRHLPVKLTETRSNLTLTVLFGPWGKPPSAKAPAKSVSLDTSWLLES